MPSASNNNRHQSQPSASRSPLSQPPLNSADVAKVRGKRKHKDASRDNIEIPQVETKAVSDDLIEQEPLSPLPAEPSPKPTYPMRDPHSNADSPILGALGTYGSTQDPEVVIRTDSWARSIPFGKSPPTEPTDGMTVGESPPQFTLPARGDAFQQPSPLSSSPHGKPRPLSYADDYSTSAPSSRSRDRQKRSSLSSHRLSHPLPHLPQPHFFHAPDVEIPGLQNQRPPSDSGYTFCSVDKLRHSSPRSSKKADDVVLVGRDSSLEVLTIDNGPAKIAAAIRGLSGRVIGAKILTWNSGADPFAAYRPLVAITIHGPAVIQKDENGTVSSGESDQTDLIPGPPKSRQKREDLLYVQTRVEVYSLRSQQLISTLFATKPVACFETFPGLRPSVPPPAANLQVISSGNYVIVASGTSGEVLIFGVIRKSSSELYQCLGKTWTNVQPREYRRYSNSSASTDTDDFQSESGGSSKLVDMPIVAIRGRWLAVVCPSPNMVSLHGSTPPPAARKRKYGIDAHVPPSRPSVTCGVDLGEGESFLNKVARGLTQEVFKGARWIGDQGMQTWNNYWNKDSQSGSSTTTMRRPNNYDQQLGPDYMPPTHAQDTQYPPPDDPDLVSIYDLKHLEDIQDVKTSFPNPVATFEPPNGCSFLSFSPNGLMLMTASKKGDVQYVWDLMQIRLCRARALITDDASSISSKKNPSAAHVRQMTMYARLTTSTVRDVIWTGHTGEHLAIITKNGTIHLHDIPPNAFRWPPLRRISNAVPSTRSDNYMREDLDEGGTFSAFSAAAKLVGDTTSPFLAAMRGRAPSVGAAFANPGFGIPLAAGYGGKAVAAGLSKSVGAATETMNNIRRSGENRLHLNRFTRDTMVSKAVWMGGKKRNICLGVIDNGAFKVYRVEKSIPPQNSNKRGQSIIGSKIQQVRLPSDMQSPCTMDQVILGVSDQVSGFYSLTTRRRKHKKRYRPLAHAEIEANAPYQPFHTDRRVNLFVYSEQDSNTSSAPWLFGDDIPTTKILLRAEPENDGDNVDGMGSKANKDDIENLISLGSAGEAAEHVVITTRRKKRSVNHDGTDFVDHEDGFFEDDCDVLDFARDRV